MSGQDETCFACGESYDWLAKGAGRSLALCPPCNAIAEDIAPGSSTAWWNHLMGMACIALIPSLRGAPELLIAGIVAGAAGVIFTGVYRLNRLGARIRDERNQLEAS